MANVVTVEVPLALLACILFVFSGLGIKYYTDNYGPLWCHESTITALFGLAIGGLFEYFSKGGNLSFDSNIFFYLVLPPIIFSAGFSLKRKKFFRYGLSIAVFGILGTLMNFAIISVTAHVFSWILGIKNMGWINCMLLGSVLSASDEVSAMSFVRMKEYPHLGALIFGEGVINDALSIAIFKTLQHEAQRDSLQTISSESNSSIITESTSSIGLLITVLMQIVTSSLVGMLIGLLNARFLKIFPQAKQNPINQTSLVLLFGMLAYSIAEYIGCSGILTLFVAAVTLSHYSWHSLSRSAQVCTKLSLCSMSDIAEGFAFAYVGLSMWGFTQDRASIVFAILMLLTVIASRFGTIFLICRALRQVSDEFNLSLNDQIGFGLGGIVRGCLCWAQILQLHDQPILITTTLFVVMVTIVGCGIMLPAVMPIVVPPLEDEVDLLPGNMTLANIILEDSMISAHDPPTTPTKKDRRHAPRHMIISLLYVLWIRFDENIMKTIFGGASAVNNESSTRALILKSTEEMSVLFMISHPAAVQAIFDGIDKPLFDQNTAIEEKSTDFDDEYLTNLIAEDEQFNRSLPYSPIRMQGTPDVFGNRSTGYKSRTGAFQPYSLFPDRTQPTPTGGGGGGGAGVRFSNMTVNEDVGRDSIGEYYSLQLQGVIKYQDEDAEQSSEGGEYYQSSV